MRVARRIGSVMIVLAFVGTVSTGVWLWQSGYRAYVVHTGSMSPSYGPGSLVFDGPAKGNYRPGQVITFRHSALTTDLVTHRITDVTKTGLIHTKGDGNGSADVWDIRPDQVKGSVIASLPFAGYVIVYLQQPAGIASVVTVLLALILLWGLWFPVKHETQMQVIDLREPVAVDVPRPALQAAPLTASRTQPSPARRPVIHGIGGDDF